MPNTIYVVSMRKQKKKIEMFYNNHQFYFDSKFQKYLINDNNKLIVFVLFENKKKIAVLKLNKVNNTDKKKTFWKTYFKIKIIFFFTNLKSQKIIVINKNYFYFYNAFF